MTEQSDAAPAGTHPVTGISHQRSPHPVGETVQRLTGAIHTAGATLFAVIDHSGEAARAGLSLRDTKLLVFGNPAGGTPAMVAAPLAAIDLPLKVLVWQDDRDAVWMSYLDPGWLAERHGLTAGLAAPLSAAAGLAGKVAVS
jgi:uncharacterized protein (DUF302 family)